VTARRKNRLAKGTVSAGFILYGYGELARDLLEDDTRRGSPVLEDDIRAYPHCAGFGVDTVPTWL
jgi:hypothetical protein